MGKRPSSTLIKTIGNYKDLFSSRFDLNQRYVIVWIVMPASISSWEKWNAEFLQWSGKGYSEPGDPTTEDFPRDGSLFANSEIFLRSIETEDDIVFVGMGMGDSKTTVVDGKKIGHYVFIMPEKYLSMRGSCTRMVN